MQAPAIEELAIRQLSHLVVCCSVEVLPAADVSDPAAAVVAGRPSLC